MDDTERRVMDRAGLWAQAVEDLDAAAQDVERAKERDSSRDRIVAAHHHQMARARLTEAEIVLLDAVRALWARGRVEHDHD